MALCPCREGVCPLRFDCISVIQECFEPWMLVCFIQAPDLRDDMYLDALNSLLISGEYPPLFSVDELDSLLQVIWQRDNNIYHSRLIILKISVKSFKASSTLPWRNLKTKFYSQFRPSVHTNPSWKQTSSKPSSNQRNLETPALRLIVDRKHFETNELTIIMIFSLPSFIQSQLNPKWPVWTKNIYCVFRDVKLV